MNREKLDHLQCIRALRPDNRRTFMETCSDNCIDSICEFCYNLIQENLPLTRKTRYRIKTSLNPIRFKLRKLADPKVSPLEKRKLLQEKQVGDGIFPLIASIVPTLISLLASK